LVLQSFGSGRGAVVSGNPTIVYKICRPEEWQAAEHDGVFCGSPDDRRDGFIHFSAAVQVPGTVEKYFSGQAGLILIAIDARALGAALKWEPSRGGALFPHLYGDLSLDAVLWARPLASITDLRQLAQ
jgi:uncharacterized protein (DUF952 family)